MALRRDRVPRKKKYALGSFINARWLAPLRELAAFVAPGKGPLTPIAADVAGVLEAAEGIPYPKIASLAAERFNAIAEQAPFRFHAGAAIPGFPHPGVFIQPVREVAIGIQSTEGRGVAARSSWAFGLAYGFFMNPERDRLRRCQLCARWFVDATRNKSSRRCSRKCTIAWSNAQRALVAKHRPRAKGGR